ncbi:MAG: peptidoglycan-binding protein [Firmicutes bacterium]|nr:peptidoglycan-binding protein [Bacillota bacterium]
MATGYLHTKVTAALETLPIEGARVIVRDKGGRIVADQLTDADGMTEYVPLEAPSKDLTLNPDTAERSYALYDVEITAKGFHPVVVHDVEIVADTKSYLPAFMHPNLEGDVRNNITRLYRRHIGVPTASITNQGDGSFQSNQPMDGQEIIISPISTTTRINPPGDLSTENIGENFDDIQVGPPAVLQPFQSGRVGTNFGPVREVIIPTYITVHLGRPDNLNARNVRVPFVEYVANVASSEIFPTWPDASLRANIHAITTFALNRIYTEWYRSRGRNFDITNSTAFDQYYVHGRNIFENLMQIAGEIFNQYVRRIGFRNPLFTTYRANACGAQCMSQWGTVTLANQGQSPLQILRNFYGQDVEISSAPVRDIRTTYPGTAMRLGSPPSRYIQEIQIYLNRIRQNFPLIPLIPNTNGVFDATTDAAVRQFQRINGLNVDGIIGPATWNRITQQWVAVTRLADLNAEGVRIGIGATPPNVVLRQGSSGNDVRQLQWLLNYIGQYYEFIQPELVVDGRFGANTTTAVREFQRNFNLNPDGIVGPNTWNRLYEVFRSIQGSSPNPAPIPPVNPPQPPVTPLPPSTGGNLIGTVRTAGGNLNVRSGPGTNFGVVTTIPNGTPLTVTGEQNGFYNIRTAGGATGWVSRDFVTISPRQGRVTTTGGNLNLRALPNTTSPVLASIPNGTVLTITDVSGNFFQTVFNGRTGWVSRDFIQFIG